MRHEIASDVKKFVSHPTISSDNTLSSVVLSGVLSCNPDPDHFNTYYFNYDGCSVMLSGSEWLLSNLHDSAEEALSSPPLPAGHSIIEKYSKIEFY